MNKHLVTPMDKAIRDCRKGRLSQTKAAAKYNVPRSTLSILCRVLRIKKGPKSHPGRPKSK